MYFLATSQPHWWPAKKMMLVASNRIEAPHVQALLKGPELRRAEIDRHLLIAFKSCPVMNLKGFAIG
jgi:hypothetical protein